MYRAKVGAENIEVINIIDSIRGRKLKGKIRNFKKSTD